MFVVIHFYLKPTFPAKPPFSRPARTHMFLPILSPGNLLITMHILVHLACKLFLSLLFIIIYSATPDDQHIFILTASIHTDMTEQKQYKTSQAIPTQCFNFQENFRKIGNPLSTNSTSNKNTVLVERIPGAMAFPRSADSSTRPDQVFTKIRYAQ